MRTTTWVLQVLLFSVTVSSGAYAEEKTKLLNRSIYMPIEFSLCKHLNDAIYYENDLATAAMPASRIFQFTYYPNLAVILPEQVPIRVEGKYAEDGEPFVAQLAVTVDGLHNANRVRSVGTQEQVNKKLHKVDIRLKPKAFQLACTRYCKRVKTVATKDP